MEAIILAGGLGTRLRGVIGEIPKCMAPVNREPFLYYLFRELAQQGAGRVVLSLGYRHEVVLDWLKDRQWPFAVDYVIEKEPLGTGGGIRLAMEQVKEEQALVLNGDTLFRVSLEQLQVFHRARKAVTTLSLKPLEHFDRYGTVVLDADARIRSFEEKKPLASGLINGGVYCISKAAFLSLPLPARFSFEKDYLEALGEDLPFYGFECTGYFIDIGIPEDYARAQEDFQTLFPG